MLIPVAQEPAITASATSASPRKALIVDLNNFARYPTLAIGYIAQPLRDGGYDVTVLSPLAAGAPPFERERRETRLEHAKRRLYFSHNPLLLPLHESMRKFAARQAARPHKATRAAIVDYLTRNQVDVILLSAYLNHRDSVEFVGKLAAARGIPLILGGPAFNQPTVSEDWIKLPGVSVIFGGECDLVVKDVVDAVIEGKDLQGFPGVFLKDVTSARPAPPLHNLDRLPIPDYSDFPWDAYPHKIIPVMTGRGCGWGICTFCSDVVTANGRSFRSRSPQVILNELATLSRRHETRDFIFLDLKLNSDLQVWRALIDSFQDTVPGGKWIATVHVDARQDNGLSREDLIRAHASGLTRISFGLETGSQRLNTLMAKGTNMERNETFVRDAAEAGLSLRASMMLGYPGETADDVLQSADFLARHRDHFDRIRLSLFKAIPGTRFATLYESRKSRFPGLQNFSWDFRYNRAAYQYQPEEQAGYRSARRQLLKLVHEINRRPLRDSMQQFDGLM